MGGQVVLVLVQPAQSGPGWYDTFEAAHESQVCTKQIPIAGCRRLPIGQSHPQCVPDGVCRWDFSECVHCERPHRHSAPLPLPNKSAREGCMLGIVKPQRGERKKITQELAPAWMEHTDMQSSFCYRHRTGSAVLYFQASLQSRLALELMWLTHLHVDSRPSRKSIFIASMGRV